MRDVQHKIIITLSGAEKRICTVGERRHGAPICGGDVLDCGLVWKCAKCAHEDLTVRGHRAELRQLVASKRPEINRLKHGVTTDRTEVGP